MTDARDAWKEVAGKAESLGLKLKLHLEQEQGVGDAVADTEAEVDTATETATDTSDAADPADSGAADAKAVIEDLSRKVQDAFDSIGNAAKDNAVHEDVKDMGRLFVEAISATFTAVGAEVASRTSGGSDSDPDDPIDAEVIEEIDSGEADSGSKTDSDDA